MPVDLKYAFGLQPEKAIEYFQSKGYTFSWNWQDTWQEAHAKAFTVAKAMRTDVLQDIRGGIDQALENGTTLEQFKKDLTPKLQAKGWWGRKMVGDGEGGATEVQLGSPHRLETIYRTNMQTAYMAGNYQAQMENVEDRPYWQYVAVMDADTRPAHRALNGKVFPFDDPFWQHFYPPNDFNCRCRVRALDEQGVEKKGLKVESSEGKISSEELPGKAGAEPRTVGVYSDPEAGINVSTGPGWNYNPGRAAVDNLENIAWQKAQAMPPVIQENLLNDLQRSPFRSDIFSRFVENTFETGRVSGRIVTAGVMQSEEINFLTKINKAPASPVIIENDKGLLHQRRAVKLQKNAALTLDEIKQTPEHIRGASAVLYDTQDPALLYVTDSADKKIKIVVRVNYALKGQTDPVNIIKTSGKVAAADLNVKRYEIIRGNL